MYAVLLFEGVVKDGGEAVAGFADLILGEWSELVKVETFIEFCTLLDFVNLTRVLC